MIEKPVANPSIVLREEFDDYALLYNPDSVEVFCLNPVGVFIWKQFDGQHTEEDILGNLRSHCVTVPETAGDDIREFIAELSGRGLIRASSA
jgi:Coenzyme PQQ synthesis protein D (PqqD).